MRQKTLFISLVSLLAAAGCYHAVEFTMPQEDGDASDDAAARDGRDLQDHDARPDAPETPDGTEIPDPRQEDMPIPDDGAQEDVAVYDVKDADLTDPVESDVADVEEEEGFEPYPANDFTLTDYNPDSPTHLQERALSGAGGKVIVLYFLSYG